MQENSVKQNQKKIAIDEIQIIPRDAISGITEINLEGENTFLGEVKNFKNNNYLKEKLPKDLSISWTKMPPEQELPTHFHPCPSVVIVSSGEGSSTGDTVTDIKTGDVIFIPEWNSHGFRGKGQKGFSALSIQFQETAIFDSQENPETTYIKKEVPLEDKQLSVINRSTLPSIHEVVVGGEVKKLGTLKNFSSNPQLDKIFPENLSMAWVSLSNEQTLETHTHETDSMIIITQGRGELVGDKNQWFSEGDVIYVPAGQRHGFIGHKEGFWALSVQFESQSLYEDLGNPQVQFISEFDKLTGSNELHAKKFKRNPVFNLDPSVFLNPQKKTLFFSGLQVMSDHFQRLMFARMALCESNIYRPIFLEHFLEELGHDTSLAQERGGKERLWDPVLEASASWFVGKNYLIDNPARIVMIQMVLEKGASIFYTHYSDLLSNTAKSQHIENHCDLDEGHDKLGVELLKDESPEKIKELHILQSQSWEILNLFLSRLEKLVRQA